MMHSHVDGIKLTSGECEGGEEIGPRPEPRVLQQLGTKPRKSCTWCKHGGRRKMREVWCGRSQEKNINGQEEVESTAYVEPKEVRQEKGSIPLEREGFHLTVRIRSLRLNGSFFLSSMFQRKVQALINLRTSAAGWTSLVICPFPA